MVFHQAVEICLNRRVGAGEYLRPQLLLREISSDLPVPAIEDILELVPREQLPLLVA